MHTHVVSVLLWLKRACRMSFVCSPSQSFNCTNLLFLFVLFFLGFFYLFFFTMHDVLVFLVVPILQQHLRSPWFDLLGYMRQRFPPLWLVQYTKADSSPGCVDTPNSQPVMSPVWQNSWLQHYAGRHRGTCWECPQASAQLSVWPRCKHVVCSSGWMECIGV